MDPRNLPARLSTEQVYALGRIIETGSLTNLGGVVYLVAPVSPMTVDFLKGARLPEFTNNILMNRAESGIVAALSAGQHIGDEGITLEELHERFKKDITGKISVGACENFDRLFGYLSDVLNKKKRIKTINREDLNKVKLRIVSMPVWYPIRFRGLTMDEAIQKADREDLPRLSLTTVNYHRMRITTIFNWAERQWLIDRNPARRLTIRVNKSTSVLKKRPFSDEQLKTIFNAPIYTGCIDDKINFSRPGPNHPRRERFWIPLIALFSGLRVNEICQMDVADVKSVEGVLCFHVTNMVERGRDDKRLKTHSADRYVPIHSELIRIGFLLYLEAIKATGRQKLFVYRLSLRGMYGGIMSSWFTQRFLKSLHIYRKETTFHSFRHCFRDALRRTNTSMYVLRELCGWALPATGLEFGYGSLLSYADLAVAIETVRYPNLDLTHLYSEESKRSYNGETGERLSLG